MTLVGVVALGLATASPTPARSEPTIYRIFLQYEANCEGFAEGELRVDGSVVELWGSSEDQGFSGEMQRVGAGRREPDDSFRIELADVGFKMHGSLLPDGRVTGSGTYSGLGSHCTFQVNGSRVGAAPTTTSSTAAPEEEVEFDPTSTEALDGAELKTVLERAGLSEKDIDNFFDQVARRRREIKSNNPAYKEVLAEAVVWDGLASIRSDDGRRLFPVLQTLFTGHDDDRCDYCGGPLALIARRWPMANQEYASKFSDALHRGIRLAIAMDLPS